MQRLRNKDRIPLPYLNTNHSDGLESADKSIYGHPFLDRQDKRRGLAIAIGFGGHEERLGNGEESVNEINERHAEESQGGMLARGHGDKRLREGACWQVDTLTRGAPERLRGTIDQTKAH